MAERRAKQLAFEEKRKQKAIIEVDEDRKLAIYTASIHLKSVPVDHTFDLSSLQLNINFSLDETALNPDIFQQILSISKFQNLLSSYLAKIEAKNFESILITCVHGLHRSVAMAEAIKQKYPLSTCTHMMIK